MAVEPDLDRFSSRRSTVFASNGIVSTSQPLAAQAGVSILQRGGNAFDAAVGTAAALNVVEPTSTGLGGDVFALYRTADGEIGGLQSCGGAPEDATIEAVRGAVASKRDVDPTTVSMPTRGPHTVTVPGTARGWETTVDEFGDLTLDEILRPAIQYAINGYPVSEVVADQWTQAQDLFTDEHARETYLPTGRPPHVGETVRLPRLGESLTKIAEQGADAVYEGQIGQAIVEEVQSKGGFLSMSDLTAFEPTFVDPIRTSYAGADVFELPPNNQGLIALEALNIAEAIDAGTYGYDTPDRVHYFVEAMKRAFVDGHHYVTDPKYADVPALASKAYARDRAADIGPAATNRVEIGVPESNGEFADTVLLTVVDAEGNLVSYINSRFMGFGSGLIAGDTGIALQNRGASFSLDSTHPNSLEPGKRPFHTLIPAIVRLGPEDWIAFGVMGGFMQPQGHLQLLSNLLNYDLPLQAALDAPRWRYLESGHLAIEERFGNSIGTKLTRRGHEVTIRPPSTFGGGQIVRIDEGTLSGASEPRKDGAAIGY